MYHAKYLYEQVYRHHQVGAAEKTCRCTPRPRTQRNPCPTRASGSTDNQETTEKSHRAREVKIWSSSHEFGSCLVNHDHGLVYVHIPKCASMWARQYLIEINQGWQTGNFTQADVQHYRPIVILRDPLDRWISHCPGVWGGSTAENFFLSDSVADDLETMRGMLWDEHVHPQSRFLSGLQSGACWVNCDAQLALNFHDLMGKLGFDVKAPGPAINVSASEKRPYQSAWQDILSRDPYRQVFEEMYQADRLLISRATFHTA